MKKDDILYGLDFEEELSQSLEKCIIKNFDGVDMSKINFPVKVYKFNRMKINFERYSVLSDFLETLDDEYGNPDGDYTLPTKKMLKAEKDFISAVEDEYVPWMCEKTGEVIELDMESVEKYLSLQKQAGN